MNDKGQLTHLVTGLLVLALLLTLVSLGGLPARAASLSPIVSGVLYDLTGSELDDVNANAASDWVVQATSSGNPILNTTPTPTPFPLPTFELILPVTKTITRTSVYSITNLSFDVVATVHEFYDGGFPGGSLIEAASFADLLFPSESRLYDLGTMWAIPYGFAGDVVIFADGPITGTILIPPFVSIHDIQFTTDPAGASPYEGQPVTTQGVVTAFFDASGRRYAFIQDGSGPWSGLLLFEPNGPVNVGDLLEVQGTVSEFFGLTEIANGNVTVLSSGEPLPAPEVLSTGDVSQEGWESVLVRVENVTVTNEDLGFGEWLVDDGSGGVRVDDLGSYVYTPRDGDPLDFVQGPLFYSFGEFKIEPRDDDDIGLAPALVPICQIQGNGLTSPYEGQTVRTQGVVFADTDQTGERGFFIQDEDCDGDPATSDGVFVYKGNRTDVVSAGDLVEVRGTVREFFDLTEISTNLSNVTVLSSGNPLPTPIDLNPPFDNAASRAYFESLEGMYVKLDDAAVVGPTSRFDETWVVRGDLGIGRVFQDDPAGTGEIVGVDDGGLFEISPEAKVGDHALGLLGALDYSFGTYKMQLTAEPTLVPAPDPPKYGDADGDGDVDLDDRAFIEAHLGQDVPPGPASADLNGDGRVDDRDLAAFDQLWNELRLKPVEFTVATFNLENLFDTVDEPGKADPVPSPADYELQLDKLAEAIHDELREPTIVGVQEAENLTVLLDLAARPQIQADYDAVLLDGPDARGIDVGLLYQTDRVTVLDYQQRQGCTTLVDGLGPDGNRNPLNPQNAVTCDSDGDGVLDGNRLFSRPPLVVHLQVRGAEQDPSRSRELWVIVNHWKSKSQDTPTVKYTLPRRIEQATFVAGLAQEILGADPGANLIALGDLNDFLNSQPLAVLTNAGLSDLLLEVPKPERYTYVFQGESEVLDHVLISSNLWDEFVSVTPVHINADYPDAYSSAPDIARRSSDHDPVLARFALFHTSAIPAAVDVSGYVDSRHRLDAFFGSGYLWTGQDTRPKTPRWLHGVFQVDLAAALPEGAIIVEAGAELTGRSTRYLSPGLPAEFTLNLLPSSFDTDWTSTNYYYVHNATPDATLAMDNPDLAVGGVNSFTFSQEGVAALQARLEGTGRASFRADGEILAPYGRHVMGWDGRTSAPPVLRVTYYVP